ncbi:MAG: NUDIX hydrolase [Waddliaceae bacterium]|nr:NUDIX hydrolase [Waddliaceae bacterium]
MSKLVKQDTSFKTNCGRFNYRVAAVILREGKILLLTEPRFDFWYLPGGRAHMFESSEEALRREIEEELGEAPKIERLLWIVENMYHFEYTDTNYHEMAFYYLIHFKPDALIYQEEKGVGTEEFSNEETILYYQWFPLDQLEYINLVPSFMKEALKEIPSQTKHIIMNELVKNK